jgi:hypothetical protein
MKQGWWNILLLVGVVVLLLWLTGGVREWFSLENPIITYDDVNSLSDKTPSPNAQKLREWLEKNIPSAKPRSEKEATIFSLMRAYGSNIPSSVDRQIDLETFFNIMMSVGATVNNMSPSKEELIKDYNDGIDPSGSRLYSYAVYSYYYGSPPKYEPGKSGPPMVPGGEDPMDIPPPPYDISDQAEYDGGLMPFPPPPPIVPMIAQDQAPPPPSAEVPSPCKPSIKSIPGGTIETKCFN